MDYLDEFLPFGPQRVALVEDVRFRIRIQGEKLRASRRVLVISTNGLNAEGKSRIRQAYLRALAKDTVSFPIKQRVLHLRTRIDESVFNFGRFIVNYLPRFRTRNFQVPASSTFEVVIKLNQTEIQNLQSYIRNIKKAPYAMLGRFNMEGTQNSVGQLNDNRPTKGIHNCTSWITTAPIAEDGRSLMEVMGASRELMVGTNPGWWVNWLAVSAAHERLPFIIHWSKKTIEAALKEDVISGKNLDWNFNKH